MAYLRCCPAVSIEREVAGWAWRQSSSIWFWKWTPSLSRPLPLPYLKWDNVVCQPNFPFPTEGKQSHPTCLHLFLLLYHGLKGDPVTATRWAQTSIGVTPSKMSRESKLTCTPKKHTGLKEGDSQIPEQMATRSRTNRRNKNRLSNKNIMRTHKEILLEHKKMLLQQDMSWFLNLKF